MTVYLVFERLDYAYCGPDRYKGIFASKETAQAWIDGQLFPENFYINEEEPE